MSTARLDDVWAASVTSALLGTSRRPPPPHPGPPLHGFGDAGGADPAEALLDRLAALTVARRAGAALVAAPPPLPPCPPDHRPPCPPAAARRLALLLDGLHADLLDEWVRRAVSGGWAPPPEHVLAVLDRSRLQPSWRHDAQVLAGSAGAWLVSVLPGVAAAAPPLDPEVAWRLGSPAEQAAAVVALRAADRVEARRRVEEALPAAGAAERAALVAGLAEGLAPDDEPLLEALLADRAAGVRATAADLLVRLPSSSLAGRWAGRLRALVGGPPLELDLPIDVPPEWVRDGLDPRPLGGRSRGVHLLAEVARRAPVRAWQHLGPPAQLVALLRQHELGPLLLEGLAEAAERERDADLALALIEMVPRLVPLLRPADVLEVACRQAGPDGLLTRTGLVALAAVPEPWPADLRDRVLATLAQLLADGRVTWEHRPALRSLLRQVDPAVLAPFAATVAARPPLPHLAALEPDLVELARFRHDLVEELRP